jgi:hypothetical protein
MRKHRVAIFLSLGLSIASNGKAAGGEFIGTLGGNPFSATSCSNPFSRCGNAFDPISPRNPFGPYGNRFSAYAPSNPFATRTPKVYGEAPDAADFAGDDE